MKVEAISTEERRYISEIIKPNKAGQRAAPMVGALYIESYESALQAAEARIVELEKAANKAIGWLEWASKATPGHTVPEGRVLLALRAEELRAVLSRPNDEADHADA